MQMIWIKNQPGIGRPPQDWFAVRKPGEDPHPIGQQETLWSKIAAYGNQTAFGRHVRGGKYELIRQKINRHRLGNDQL